MRRREPEPAEPDVVLDEVERLGERAYRLRILAKVLDEEGFHEGAAQARADHARALAELEELEPT